VILYIASRETDYLQDLTFAGLADVLGPESLAVFPPHWQYRRERRFPWTRKLAYPENLGSLSENVPAGGGSLSRVRKALAGGDFRAAVLGSAKPDALESFLRIEEDLNVPWIFVDGGDWREIGGDFKRLGGEGCFRRFQGLLKRRPPSAVFKRELPPAAAEDGVFPLPFSVNSRLVPRLPVRSLKTARVLFRAVESSEIRRKVFRILAGRYDCQANGSVPGRKYRGYELRGEPYFRALNGTRIALSFRGEGFDTLRYWEIPACGSLLVSEAPDIVIPDNFEDGASAVFCRPDASDLLEILDRYLSREEEAARIAEKGQELLFARHTHARRAEYLLEILEKRAGIRLVR